jgi:O-antigen/teichoic acid export membrane protein
VRFGRNALINLLGLGVPLVVAVVAIPLLLHSLGTERFGLLALIWAVVSYLGVFDLGLGRVLTQHLAVELASPAPTRQGAIIGTSMVIMACLGVGTGLLMALGAQPAATWIKTGAGHAEVVGALQAMAVAMPAVIATSGLRGALEAKQSFLIVNLIRLPMGMFNFIGPLAVVWLGDTRLDLIAWVLTAGRWIACIVHAWFVARMVPGSWAFDATLVRPMSRTGGWITLSNVASPFMGYADRFLIGALLSATAVAYYATPMELAIKLSIVPAAVTAVLFPMFAASVTRGAADNAALLHSSVRLVLGALWPACLAIALFAKELLTWWIGPDFAEQSAQLLRVFALGILVNSLAHMPLTLLQSTGLARTVAGIHLLEVPAFIIVLWWLTASFGLLGAAGAWLIRMVVDTLLMFGFAWRALSHLPVALNHVVGWTILVGASFSASWLDSAVARATVLLVATLTSTAIALRPALKALRHGDSRYAWDSSVHSDATP